MTVKILLLKSGEDVIADVKEMVSPDEKVIGYFLKKPCVVKLIPKDLEDESTKEQQYEIRGCLSQKKGNITISMYPWMPLKCKRKRGNFKWKNHRLPTTTIGSQLTMVTPIEKVY